MLLHFKIYNDTIQEENYHWNLNFAIFLMENSLKLNPAYVQESLNVSLYN